MIKYKIIPLSLPISLLIGCASPKVSITPTVNPIATSSYKTLEAKGSKIGEINNKQIKYSLESIILDREQLHVKDNHHKKSDELDFFYIKNNDASLTINPSTRTIAHSYSFLYIPTLVLNKDGKKAYKITLSSSGTRGIKARETHFDIEKIELGLLRKNQGDLEFGLKTIRIRDNDYYVPKVEEEKINDQEIIPSYHVPVEGTSIKISPEGIISLLSTQGIYLPVKTKEEDYLKRMATSYTNQNTKYRIPQTYSVE